MRPRGIASSRALIAVLDGNEHGAGPFPAERHSLQEPQRHQKHGTQHADRGVGRNEPHRGGREAHEHERDDQNEPTSSLVAEMAEDHAADRPRHVAHGIGRKGEERTGPRIERRKKQLVEDESGQRVVNRESTPYSWSVVAGSLPAGLSLGAASGVVSGTPTTVGTSTFTAGVADDGSPPRAAQRDLSISIVGSLPGAFGKSSPPNNAKNQTTRLTLAWAASSGATSYEYCLAGSRTECQRHDPRRRRHVVEVHDASRRVDQYRGARLGPDCRPVVRWRFG